MSARDPNVLLFNDVMNGLILFIMYFFQVLCQSVWFPVSFVMNVCVFGEAAT